MPHIHDFARRHLGSNDSRAARMLGALGYDSLDQLIDDAVPAEIRLRKALDLPPALNEQEALATLRGMMDANATVRSFIGQGYYGCVVPPVIQRNIFENPGWYTAYTPYQAEIAQGRLEALLNFQTMVADLTGLDVANASLLDEGTAVAEAMALASASKPQGNIVFISDDCHPQTLDVVRTRAEPLGIAVLVGDEAIFDPAAHPGLIATVSQYPGSGGEVRDPSAFIKSAHDAGALAIVATDLLALTLLKPPGELGADIAVGSSQRFGVPLGNGGPHAAFMACKDGLKRRLPGRIIGISKDADGNPAYRLSLQTREQHIRRDKATSNICTAQVLLAVMASMYAVYHGPDGLRRIARFVHSRTVALAARLRAVGHGVENDAFFDTLTITPKPGSDIAAATEKAGINLRLHADGKIGLSLDETVTDADLTALLGVFGDTTTPALDETASSLPESLLRTSAFLTQPVFSAYHTETEMLRYLRALESKDLALNHSMIPLGSCTMKLNATAEMMPLSWASVTNLHPFAPDAQKPGYNRLFSDLETWLSEITGFAACSLQPNAGSQGEYAGLLAIRAWHQSRGDTGRDICLIPTSAHGTNPASAVMVGFKVVPVKCDDAGNIDVADIEAKAAQYADSLGALMITYPSTHGVFETSVRKICEIIHAHGGQVYMDGANMNAQVGLCSPGDIGADVCHLNLHKTFCIPHGGGGPGVGPIGVAAHLAPFLPGRGVVGPVCSAPYGSAAILVISWMYIAMMGADGLTDATKLAILNANYIARRLEKFYPVLYHGRNGRVAHECIIDLRPLKATSGVEVEDVAKRLMDYGFHSPTMSWPVAGTLMIEPTESESLEELDRFCDAMISIHGEIRAIQNGEADPQDNVLKRAPHTVYSVTADDWNRPYSRESAAFPNDWTRQRKFWPPVSRIDNVYGDRHLICTCAPMDEHAAPETANA